MRATLAAVLFVAACDTAPRPVPSRDETNVAESTSAAAQTIRPEPAPLGAAVHGTVRWFDDAKGYGFIAPDDGSGDVLVSHTVIQMEGFRTLKRGQRVRLVIRQGTKGREATDVEPLATTSPR